MINVGFIGSGKSVHRYHLPYLLELKDQYLVKTIYSPHAKSTKWEKISGVNYSENLDDVLLDESLDLVIISTNQKYHYYYAKLCLEHHKNVVVEKPFCNTYLEAKELFDLARKNNLVLEAYQNRRFDSDFLTLKEILKDERLGKVYEIENNFDYYRQEQLEESNNLDKYQAFIYGHGAHTIDQMISLFGIPTKVHTEVKALIDGKMLDYFDVDLYFNDLKVSCKSSFLRAVARPSFIIYGTKGRYLKLGNDCQERDLKRFYMPSNEDFGKDKENGLLTYYSDGVMKEEEIPQLRGNYKMYYEALYRTIVYKEEKVVKDIETLTLMKILEDSIKDLN